jgi:hypothetical protein
MCVGSDIHLQKFASIDWATSYLADPNNLLIGFSNPTFPSPHLNEMVNREFTLFTKTHRLHIKAIKVLFR